MKNFVSVFFFVCLTSNVLAQFNPVKEMIEKGKSRGETFAVYKLFLFSETKTIAGNGKYNTLLLNPEIREKILKESPNSLLFQVPTGRNELIETELMLVDNGLSNNVTINNVSRIVINSRPLFYRGIIKDFQGKSSVALVITSNLISVFISLPDATITIKKSERLEPDSTYILYNTKQISFPPDMPFVCGTEPLDPSSNNRVNSTRTSATSSYSDKCVYIFFDCDDSLYRHCDTSVTTTVNYVYSLFNQIALAYSNEGIRVKISQINVWTTANPFVPGQLLETFAAYYQENFFGNLAFCLDWGTITKSGISGATGRVKADNSLNGCTGYTPGNGPKVGTYSYCDINYFGNYANFPVASDVKQVYLIIHEMGHLLGSSHTHWCGWDLGNGITGALDNCVAQEGTCAPGPTPTNGGTFMSYCLYTGQFVNFNNGFGQLPGNAIRNFVGSSNCLTDCSTCLDYMTIGQLSPSSTYHYEVSISITLNGLVPNTTIANVDAGTSIHFMPGFKAAEGSRLKAYIDGCGGIK